MRPFYFARWPRFLKVSRMAAGGFSDARNISAASPCAGKGTAPETLDCLSHDTDRWALHLLQRSRSERRADGSTAARTSVFLADCSILSSASFPITTTLSRRNYPGFGHSDWPDPKKFAYTFDHIAEIMNHFTEALWTPAIHALHAGLRRPRRFSYGYWFIRSESRRSLFRTPLRTMKVSERFGKHAWAFGLIAPPMRVRFAQTSCHSRRRGHATWGATLTSRATRRILDR